MLGETHTRDDKTANGRVHHPQRIYFDRIGQILKSPTRWLDVGCGRQLVPWWMKGNVELEDELKSRARWLVGIDPDLMALRDNRACHLRLKVDKSVLPFADGAFDLITSNMVFEHVEDPRPLLAEIRRVLRRGGRLVMLTPNWLDIVTIAARSVPNRLHPAIVSRLETRGEEDVYPTYFRFNRPGLVKKLLHVAGFNDCRIDLLDQPDTYSHVPVLSRIEAAWHGLAQRWPVLRGTLLIEAK
ncbi:MAG: class I SAM-dependent methyltransferase [Acidobacteria bacterium]|nr:class I SAM-dependent methyltransferase [Acidobacteriota bacterium]